MSRKHEPGGSSRLPSNPRSGQKKKSPAAGRAQLKATSQVSSASRHCDRGRARSPRYLRLLRALLRGAVTREHADRIAGASNSPGLVLQMRRDGLNVHCDQRAVIDRDGRTCWPGTYRLDPRSRRKAQAILEGSQ